MTKKYIRIAELIYKDKIGELYWAGEARTAWLVGEI